MPPGYITPVAKFDVQHESTEHLAINNSRTRRLLTLLALKTTARLFEYDSPCFPISKRLIVKTGLAVHLMEATTMQYVGQKTSLPVPRVHCSFVQKNRAYIVMERIRGDTLAAAWPKLSVESRQKVLSRLKVMLQELRALQPTPGAGIQSCVGGSLRDSRIPWSYPRMGPFKTIQEFHLWLRAYLQPSNLEHRDGVQDWPAIRDMIARQDGPWPPPVFTHGDLNPANILIRGDDVVGIVDWEFSGWYPHYWEYTSAWYCDVVRDGWGQRVNAFLESFPDELKMERTRQKWWGEV